MRSSNKATKHNRHWLTLSNFDYAISFMQLDGMGKACVCINIRMFITFRFVYFPSPTMVYPRALVALTLVSQIQQASCWNAQQAF